MSETTDPSLAPGRQTGSTAARKDSPSVLVLLARGWTIEHVDERYDTFLMRKEVDE